MGGAVGHSLTMRSLTMCSLPPPPAVPGAESRCARGHIGPEVRGPPRPPHTDTAMGGAGLGGTPFIGGGVGGTVWGGNVWGTELWGIVWGDALWGTVGWASVGQECVG